MNTNHSQQLVTVVDFDTLTPDVFSAKFQLAADSSFSFSAGQYLLLVLNENDKRPFSIASSPDDLPMIELHIRKQPGNPFTEEAIELLAHKNQIIIEGPFGACTFPGQIDPELTTEWVFIVGGTGFAPVKSILETSFKHPVPLRSYLFWGVGAEEDLYIKSSPEQWENLHQHFHFHPVIFNPKEEWQGLVGLVHKAAIETLPKPLSSYRFYLAGSMDMITAVLNDLLSSGIPSQQIYGDMIDMKRTDGSLE